MKTAKVGPDLRLRTIKPLSPDFRNFAVNKNFLESEEARKE